MPCHLSNAREVKCDNSLPSLYFVLILLCELVSSEQLTVFLVCLQSHLKSCEYREIQCTQCGQYIRYNLLDQHKGKECPMRPVLCEHCKKDIPYQQMKVRKLKSFYSEKVIPITIGIMRKFKVYRKWVQF